MKKQTNNIFVWDYTVNYFNTISPYPNLYTLQPNLQYFTSQGFKKIFEQGFGSQKGEFSELRAYLNAKLLWNPNLNQEKLIEEFVVNYYGAGFSDVKSYIKSITDAAAASKVSLTEYTSPEAFKNSFLEDIKISSYTSMLRSALAKVAVNSKNHARIEKELLAVKYADLEITFSDFEKMHRLGKQNYRNHLEEFSKDTQRLGITFLRNGELNAAEYKKKSTPQ